MKEEIISYLADILPVLIYQQIQELRLSNIELGSTLLLKRNFPVILSKK